MLFFTNGVNSIDLCKALFNNVCIKFHSIVSWAVKMNKKMEL